MGLFACRVVMASCRRRRDQGGEGHAFKFYYYVLEDLQGEGCSEADLQNMQIFLDRAPLYCKNDVFMLIRCVHASDIASMEFHLEGFARFSHSTPSSESAQQLHFSDFWPHKQSPAMLWKSAEVAGLPLTGPYQCSNDVDPKRQACSRLCLELFGKRPANNSGKNVTEKFQPWVARMFEEAASASVVTPTGSPSESRNEQMGEASRLPSKRTLLVYGVVCCCSLLARSHCSPSVVCRRRQVTLRANRARMIRQVRSVLLTTLYTMALWLGAPLSDLSW